MVLLILLALTSGVAIILALMVLGLLEAPWPVLMLLLFLSLLGLQRLAAHAIERDSSLETLGAQANLEKERSASPESQGDDSPTCTYRGIKYSPPSFAKSSIDEQPTITEGIYRGQPWRRANTNTSKHVPPSSDQSTELKYRGNTVNQS